MSPERPLSFLIVDGDPAYRAYLQALLRQHLSCRVHLAASGTELAEFLTSRPQPLSLIILDWFVPDGTAGEALQQLRRDRVLRTVPVLVLTAGTNQERLRRQALAAGATAGLSKAVPDRELLAQILSLCQTTEPTAPGSGCPLRLLGRLVARTDCAAVAPLTRSQAELLGLLLQDGRPLVPHAELESKTVAYQATADRADALRKRVYRLNQRLAPLAVQVRAKRGQGYRLVWH